VGGGEIRDIAGPLASGEPTNANNYDLKGRLGELCKVSLKVKGLKRVRSQMEKGEGFASKSPSVLIGLILGKIQRRISITPRRKRERKTCITLMAC